MELSIRNRWRIAKVKQFWKIVIINMAVGGMMSLKDFKQKK